MAIFVLMDGGANYGDGGACTHITWQSAVLISKVSVCTILTN